MSRPATPHRLRWIAATLVFALLFVAGGMWISNAHADPAPAARVDRTLVPAKRAPVAAPAAPAAQQADYVVKRVLDVRGPMRPGDWYWDDAGVPDGPVVITADLKAQTLSVFRAGYEIGTAVILYGADDKPTPLGVFPILQKKARHFSITYNNAPMPFMQRLTNDGVALHGTPVVGPNLATHGCIGLPNAFAERLFGATKVGDRVIVTNGERLDLGGAITAA